MSMFPSFLEQGPNTPLPRQAPSPAQQSQQHVTNGIPGGMVNVFPTAAGHQLDLNHLWNQVQELSGLLERNRESSQGIVRRVGEIRERAAIEGASPLLKEINGELNAPNTASLTSTISLLREENSSLHAENTDLSLLVSDYETVLEKTLEQLRLYAHENTMTNMSLHRHYTSQLVAERAECQELRQQIAEFQARLAGMAGLLREAYAFGEGEAEALGEIEGLRSENRTLRIGLGLEKEDD
ncbi:hypothetical protein GP486_003698 [Trichoglossum hirsutum]|uniref:Uncharacterized protein n=1 Tax=Trichoglossum hirsutum TaxID=265104 RepID=A0A9P8LCJ5_9PEZI|nr:hypothetical protein GP486_003698 [Trichoglossum hirsutum]